MTLVAIIKYFYSNGPTESFIDPGLRSWIVILLLRTGEESWKKAKVGINSSGLVSFVWTRDKDHQNIHFGK